jgi:ParB family chromosome partitioning protein
LRAARLLGWSHVAVIFEEKELCPGETWHRMLSANLQRKSLAGIEAAHGIRDLMASTGWNAREAAEKLGVSDATVSRLLALLSLPEPIQEKVQSGAIAPALGYELSKVADPRKQAEMADEAANGRLTRDAAGAQARRQSDGPSPAETPALSHAKAVLADGRSVTVRGPRLTLETFVACLEDLLSRARRARRQGTELVTFLKSLKEQG